jgi:hypothetical protein
MQQAPWTSCISGSSLVILLCCCRRSRAKDAAGTDALLSSFDSINVMRPPAVTQPVRPSDRRLPSDACHICPSLLTSCMPHTWACTVQTTTAKPLMQMCAPLITSNDLTCRAQTHAASRRPHGGTPTRRPARRGCTASRACSTCRTSARTQVGTPLQTTELRPHEDACCGRVC